MHKNHGLAVSLVAGVATLGLLTGCGGASGPAAAPTAKGPVSIDVWGWDAEGTQQVVDAFNASQDKIKVNYVLQASNTATQTNFRNVMASKQNIPCWMPGTGPISTAVVNGWAQDVTKYVTPIADRFSSGALAAAKLDDKYYGYPSGPSALFMMANASIYTSYGIPVPVTWEDMISAGKVLKTHGVTVMNLAGEDPSTLLQLSQEAGASWFTIDGNTWKVNFLDDATLKAAGIVQQLIDGDLVSHQTYHDKPALYSYFDSGKLATIPLAWWSMGGYQTNFTTSLGQWKAYPFPQFDGAKKFVTAGIADVGFVPVGCDNPAAAIDYLTWASTSEAGIAAGKSKKTGAIAVPASLADTSPYTEAVVPAGLFVADQTPAQIGGIIATAQSSAVGRFDRGPNYDAWFPEMQDQWGKAVAKQITIEQALKNVQDFVASDLKSKGISYTDGQ